jgi:hypothetical protein
MTEMTSQLRFGRRPPLVVAAAAAAAAAMVVLLLIVMASGSTEATTPVRKISNSGLAHFVPPIIPTDPMPPPPRTPPRHRLQLSTPPTPHEMGAMAAPGIIARTG